MNKRVRVRFAPSPTGGLHLGGVRTVLYNYLFARQHGGDFILRIEDTDQTRFVPGAEEYIFDCLRWCGLEPGESVQHGGKYGPYRQSERKEIYRKYAEELVSKGFAYYAFDTPEELEQMRNELRNDENPSPQYDSHVRMKMKNSLTLSRDEVDQLIRSGTPYVTRIRMPEHETVSFIDMIRGEIHFDSSLVDDKVLLKADGMPTYHLAVVVDDHLMEISHAFRGEEWLSSAPVHILLWKYLFGLENMPQWAHFPLIMGPNGKLSKRDGAKYGFPVFAMNWQDPKTGELTEGFKEKGFLPEAFVNLLALLGWNDGSEREIYSLEDLVSHFSMDRVHSAGARFDFEKAKWFNHEWIKRLPVSSYIKQVEIILQNAGFEIPPGEQLRKIIELVKERCFLLNDFVEQAGLFFRPPQSWDIDAVKPKWSKEKADFFREYAKLLSGLPRWESPEIETEFRNLAAQKNIKPGELQLPLRIMLVGGKYGPPVFNIVELIGKEDAVNRIGRALENMPPPPLSP
jgi:glutamyl-tRNA synthetase